MSKKVLCQQWEESERGWGSRPDGYSLHINESQRLEFIKNYWASVPKEVPDEYSRPCGTAYLCDVSEEDFEELVNSKSGIWVTNNNYPKGNKDGWTNQR